MRVAYVNMSEPGATCPQGLSQRVFSGLTLCGRSMDGCQSTMFSTLGLNYSHVCGQARGYQYYTPDAFGEVENFNTIDGPYVDGLSITYMEVIPANIFAPMLVDFVKMLFIIMILIARAIRGLVFPFLLLLVMTTIVSLVLLFLDLMKLPTVMTPSGMGSNVIIWSVLAAVTTQTCLGFTHHSMQPSMRTLS